LTRAERAEQEQLLRRLRRDGAWLAARFALRPTAIEAERANVKRRYGICYADGTIRIRLRHARTGRLLKYSSLVDTLCHELAHLRHFDHGRRFQTFYRRLLAHAREAGVYRPDPPRRRPLRRPERGPLEPRVRPPRAPSPGAGRPVQLELF
jgi:predicted metal-dependent hydrolase